jgi:predicted Zn-dependent protease
MRYLCLNCETRFEHDPDAPGGKKLRCPSCMRVTGLEKLASAQTKAPERPWLMPAIGAGVLAVVFGGYMVWRSSRPTAVTGDAPLRPLESSELDGYLRAESVGASRLAELLVASDDLAAFARAATSDHDGPQDRAAAMQEAMRERASESRFVRWSMGIPRETPPAPAGVAFEWLGEEDARARLYPLEAAAIAVAGLRSADVEAMVVEIYKFPGDESPPDPAGHFGYYGVAVYDGEVGEGDPTIYDPWGGHDVAPEEDDYRVMTDVEAVGAALSIQAIQLMVRESDPERALSISGDAISACPSSPAVRSVRGAILLTAGNPTEALAELEAAEQLRSDGPRHNMLAGIYLAQGENEDALREVNAALEEFPDYAAAHATLAALHMADASPDEALTEMRTAERLDPELHVLPGLWASYYASTGDLDRAVEYAARSVEVNPDMQSRLMAARIYRMAARYDDMRREARAVMDATPEDRRERMEAMILEVLGPTALEDLDEEISDEELEASGDGSLELSLDSDLLGEDGDEDLALDLRLDGPR